MSGSASIRAGVIGALVAILAGCGGTQSGTAEDMAVQTRSRPLSGSSEFLYVAEEQRVAAYSINTTTGALSKAPGSPYRCGGCIGYIAVAPIGNYLYASTTTNRIVGFGIDPSSGSLNPLSGSPFSDPYGPAYPLAVTPNGGILYAGKFTVPTAYSRNNITAFTIDPANGDLSVVPGSPFRNGNAQSEVMTVTPSGNFLYITEGGKTGGEVSAFSATPSGGLTKVSGSPFATGLNPRWLSVAPNGEFLYVPGLGSDPSIPGTVSVYSINPGSGALTEIYGSPYSLSGGPGAVAITPSGAYAYIALNYSNEIAAFSVASSGGLTQISGSPFRSGGEPYDSVIDPSGKFLYVALLGPQSIGAYAINSSNGQLSRIPSKSGRFKSRPGELAVAVPRT